MGAKILTYIFLVFVTLKLQETSASACGAITLSDNSKGTVSCCVGSVQGATITGTAKLNVYNCATRSARDAGPATAEDSSKSRVQRSVQANSITWTEFGTKDWPAEALCKSAPSELESGTYYLGPTGNPMVVYCNMATRETCIRTSKTTPEFSHDPSEGAFWLHEENVQLKDLYAEISVEQLTWLRDRAESVRQTLKYNCLDTVPYSKFNVSSSVKLWAWNDVLIRPYLTNQSPIFYSIPEATDKCVKGSTEWQSTIIELQSSNVYRLPIVDMWIGDIRNEKQKLTIQSVELCFA